MPATIKSQKGENNGHYKHGGKHIANLLEVEIGFSDGKFTKIEVSALKDALSLINSQEQRIKELAEENERLMREKTALECVVATARNQAKADTVRKMHSMLCEGRLSNDNVVIVANQVAKEMLEGEING